MNEENSATLELDPERGGATATGSRPQGGGPVPEARRKGAKRRFLRAAVSGGLIAFLASRVEWAELRRLTGSLTPGWFLPAFALMYGTTFLGTVKWQIFLRADGVKIPLLRLFHSFLVGVFFSCFLPSSIGGDVYRVVAVGRAAGSSKSLASVVMGRVTGFFALALIGLVAAVACWEFIEDRRIIAMIAAVMLAIVIAFGLVSSRRVGKWGSELLHAWRWHRIASIAGGVQESILTYRRQPRVLVLAIAVSILQQFSMLVSVYSMSRLLGLEADFLYFLAFVPVIEALAAIPISIFGLGVRDAGYALLFTQIGLTRAECLGLSILYVAMSLLYASTGGILFALRRSEPGTESS